MLRTEAGGNGEGVGTEGYCQPAGSWVGVLGVRQRSERASGCKRGSVGREEAGDDSQVHWLGAASLHPHTQQTLLSPTSLNTNLDHTTVRLLGASF